MNLFQISGKFEQDGEWSSRDADFVGYFVKRENDVIEGYLEEKYPTPFDKIRYIKGLFIENANQLVFMKMCNVSSLFPLAYVFTDIHKEGFWDGFSYHGGFFAYGSYQGHARVEIKEVTEEDEKNRLIKQVTEIFSERASRATGMNRDLMADVHSLKDFLDENSGYCPK